MRMQVITHTLLLDGVVYDNENNPIVAADVNLPLSNQRGLIDARKIRLIPDEEANRLMAEIADRQRQAAEAVERKAATEREAREAADNIRKRARNANENNTKLTEGAIGGVTPPPPSPQSIKP